MELGNSVPDLQLDRIIESQKANQCAVIIYTSGTMGNPKGVMLSHDNVRCSSSPLVFRPPCPACLQPHTHTHTHTGSAGYPCPVEAGEQGWGWSGAAVELSSKPCPVISAEASDIAEPQFPHL